VRAPRIIHVDQPEVYCESYPWATGAARAMVAMSVQDLADSAQVHRRTIRRLECGDKESQLRILRVVGEAFLA
jgi:DNA-binding XRE family transcriptional regulator